MQSPRFTVFPAHGGKNCRVSARITVLRAPVRNLICRLERCWARKRRHNGNQERNSHKEEPNVQS